MSMSTVQQPMPDNKGQQPSSLENAAKILGIGLSALNTGTGIYNSVNKTADAAKAVADTAKTAAPQLAPAAMDPKDYALNPSSLDSQANQKIQDSFRTYQFEQNAKKNGVDLGGSAFTLGR